ncbi:MAG: type II secretion system F family protein [Lentisphaerae bacterium]|nr:type II secretion system F family protein [Lentisphaerota bacterium]
MSPVVRSQTRGGAAQATTRAKAAPKSAATRRPGSRKRIPGARKITGELLPGFSRQLGAMLAAGMPVVASLDALHEQAENPHFKRVIADIRRSIENGASLSDAFRLFPSIFDDLYTNMVRGGETGGQLPETVSRLASFLEASAKLRRKVKSAMMYPVIVLCISIGIAIAMILFIIPVFGDMYADFGADLPGPTQFLMRLSDGMRAYGFYILIVVVVLVVAFKKWKSSESGALAFDKFVLRVPVFGELNRKVAAARFAKTFGQMIRSGVPILEALLIVSGATGNKAAGQVILKARGTVERGDRLSSALISQKIFPSMLVRMLQAGEKTGKVDDMMERIAEFYEDEVDTMLAGLTSLLEPLLMVFLGVIIGGIVVCMFLPIFKMGEIVSN